MRKEGLQARDVTIAELLKPQGYTTGQFGKNHLGDRDEHAAHGARVRRVLRHPLPPERGRGAGNPRLLQGSGASEEIRPARRDPLLGEPGRDAEDRGAPARSPTKRMETIDEEVTSRGD